MSKMLNVEQVTLRYPNGHLGLSGVDFSADEGELIAVIGPSGSGKTTLLRAVAGFINPSEGRIVIGGDTVFGDGKKTVPPEKRKLGMVFQQHAIWPHMDIAGNVAYPLKLAKVPKGEQQKMVGDILELVGLAGFEKREPDTLSGGQRQRVALARALVNHPRLLLLDEALSALDEPLRDVLRLELRSLGSKLGLTMLHVTHDRNEAIALADKMLVLDKGVVMQQSTPKDLLENPTNPFVAKFLSDAAVIPGSVRNRTFESKDGKLTYPVPVEQTTTVSGSLVIMPDDIELNTEEHGGERAKVISALYGRDNNEVVVDWNGYSLRCRQHGPMLRVDQEVGIRVNRARFYPEYENGKIYISERG